MKRTATLIRGMAAIALTAIVALGGLLLFREVRPTGNQVATAPTSSPAPNAPPRTPTATVNPPRSTPVAQPTGWLTPPARATIVPPTPFRGTPPPTPTPLPLPLLTPISTQPSVLRFTNEVDLGTYNGGWAAWSPSGKQLLFPKQSGYIDSPDHTLGWSLYDLWIVNADGSRPRLLISNASDPTWSRDGRSIYYHTFVPRDLQRGSNNLDIYVANEDGSGKRLLSQGHGTSGFTKIQVLPGDQLAFLKDRRHPAIFDAQAQRITREMPTLAFRDSSPTDSFAFSADGRRLLYSLNQQMWLANADGTGAKQLPIARTVFPPEPWWSPDGQRFALSDSSQIWVGNADGTNMTPLAGVEALPKVLDDYGGITNPHWSSDGKLLFVAVRVDRYRPLSLYVIDATGGQPELLANNRSVVGVSPDGQHIALIGDDGRAQGHLTIATLTR